MQLGWMRQGAFHLDSCKAWVINSNLSPVTFLFLFNQNLVLTEFKELFFSVITIKIMMQWAESIIWCLFLFFFLFYIQLLLPVSLFLVDTKHELSLQCCYHICPWIEFWKLRALLNTSFFIWCNLNFAMKFFFNFFIFNLSF